MTSYQKITEPVTVDVVGLGPVTLSDGYLITTERSDRFDYRTTEPDSGEFDQYDPDTESDGKSDDLYDPTAHTVSQVADYYAKADNDERKRIIDAESASETPRLTVLRLGGNNG